MNEYEIAILFHPSLESDLEKAKSKFAKIVIDNGGKVTAEDLWGKRVMTYKIAGQESAIYCFYTVELPAVSVRKVEETLNITDEVIRFLIVKPDHKARAKAEAVRAAKKRTPRESDESAA